MRAAFQTVVMAYAAVRRRPGYDWARVLSKSLRVRPGKDPLQERPTRPLAGFGGADSYLPITNSELTDAAPGVCSHYEPQYPVCREIANTICSRKVAWELV